MSPNPYRRGKKGQRKQPRPNYRKAERAKQASQEERAVPSRIPERGNPDTVASPGPLAPPPRVPKRREPGPVVSLDPLAPVIVRSGRPFDDQSDADPARFPPPSTVAGCLRTAWARATGRAFGPELARLTVAGPLLLDRKNRILAPKPADALYFGHDEAARCVRAEPRPFDTGCGANAGCGADMPDALLPVQLTESVDGKPGSGPAWWSWEDLLAFRREEVIPSARTTRTGVNGRTDEAARTGGSGQPPPLREDRRTHAAIDPDTDGRTDGAARIDGSGRSPPLREDRRTHATVGPGTDAAGAADAGRLFYTRLCENGWSPPQGDRRTHVAINPDTRAADAGRLFQTEGLDLDAPTAGQDRDPPTGERRWPAAGGLRLLARCGEALGEGLVHLGGERRLAALQPEPEHVWPSPPPDWPDRIADANGLSLTLLTPAIFSAGYRPGWLDAGLIGNPPTAPGLRLQLRAVAVGRWQSHSGWDLARRRPRPSRKLAGAGATYWFSILDGFDSRALDALWLASVSDGEQDRRDGFGLALPSPWKPV